MRVVQGLQSFLLAGWRILDVVWERLFLGLWGFNLLGLRRGGWGSLGSVGLGFLLLCELGILLGFLAISFYYKWGEGPSIV